LNLARNRLIALPAELGQLRKLKQLKLDNNPDLQHPPPEVVARGAQAILAYLREQQGTR